MDEMLTERVGCADEAGGVLCAEGERDDEDEDEDDIRAMAVEEKRRRWGERERRAKRPIEHRLVYTPSCGLLRSSSSARPNSAIIESAR